MYMYTRLINMNIMNSGIVCRELDTTQKFALHVRPHARAMCVGEGLKREPACLRAASEGARDRLQRRDGPTATSGL